MNGIEIEGFEEIEKMIQDMTLSETDEKKAIRLAIKPISEEVKNNTPIGATKKLSTIKTTVKKEGFATVGRVRLGAWWDRFQEFGTSKQKRNVGFFERSVNRTQGEALRILGKELLSRIK